MFMNASEYTIIPIEGEHTFRDKEYSAVAQLGDKDIEDRIEKILEWNPGILQSESQVEILEPVGEPTSDESGEEVEDDKQADEPAKIRKSKASTQVSVSTSKLDHLINIVSELVTFRSELQYLMQEARLPTPTGRWAIGVG